MRLIKHQIPHRNILDGVGFSPGQIALSVDKKNVDLGYMGGASRRGVPEPKRCFLFDGSDDTLELVIASVGTLYVSGVLMDGTLDTDIAISYDTDRYKITKTVNEKVFNIKVWTADTATEDEKKSYSHIPSHSWLKGDDGAGFIARDSSGNGNDWTIAGATLASFHYSGSDVPFSWQNEMGFNDGLIAYASDFSAGTDGWATLRTTLAGNQDGVTDGELSKDDCLKITLTGGNNTHHTKIATITEFVAFRLRAWCYIPSGGTLGGVRILANDWHDDYVSSTVGKWFIVDLAIEGKSNNELRFYPTDGAGIMVDADGDFFYLSNVIIDELHKYPRDETNVTKDVIGNPLLKAGCVKQLVKITQVNVASLNGTSRYVAVPNSSPLQIGSGADRPAFSVSAFIYMNDEDSFRIVSKGSGIASVCWRFDMNSVGNMAFGIAQEGSTWASDRILKNSGIDLSGYINQWLFVRGSYDGGTDYTSFTLKAYVMATGEAIDLGTFINNDLGTFTATRVLVNDLNIGGNYESTYGNGMLSDVRIHSGVLNDADDVKLMRGEILGNEIERWAVVEGRGGKVYGLLNDNHGDWVGHSEPNQWTKDDDAINQLMLLGCEVYDDDATHANKIFIPHKHDGGLLTPTISGYSKIKDLMPIAISKRFDNHYACELDFQSYKALHEDLPADYQEGDTLEDVMLVDDDDTDKIKKIVVASEAINTNNRLKKYTRTA